VFKTLWIKTKRAFYIQCPFSEYIACYEIMWKNIVEPDNAGHAIFMPGK
jgi:hypothetical protein